MKKLFTIFLLLFAITQNYSQVKNSEARQFIENAEITQINKDWNVKADSRRISIYLKDNGITDYGHYFWTETQVGKIPDLLKMLKQIK